MCKHVQASYMIHVQAPRSPTGELTGRADALSPRETGQTTSGEYRRSPARPLVVTRRLSRLTFPCYAGNTRAAFSHGLTGDVLEMLEAYATGSVFQAAAIRDLDITSEDRARVARGIPSVFA